MKENLLAFLAVIVLTLFGVSVIAQTQQLTPEQLQALLASAREQRDAATQQIEQLGAILRLERAEAAKKAAECQPKEKEKAK